MELKFTKVKDGDPIASSNRTFMELKCLKFLLDLFKILF